MSQFDSIIPVGLQITTDQQQIRDEVAKISTEISQYFDSAAPININIVVSEQSLTAVREQIQASLALPFTINVVANVEGGGVAGEGGFGGDIAADIGAVSASSGRVRNAAMAAADASGGFGPEVDAAIEADLMLGPRYGADEIRTRQLNEGERFTARQAAGLEGRAGGGSGGFGAGSAVDDAMELGEGAGMAGMWGASSHIPWADPINRMDRGQRSELPAASPLSAEPARSPLGAQPKYWQDVNADVAAEQARLADPMVAYQQEQASTRAAMMGTEAEQAPVAAAGGMSALGFLGGGFGAFMIARQVVRGVQDESAAYGSAGRMESAKDAAGMSRNLNQLLTQHSVGYDIKQYADPFEWGQESAGSIDNEVLQSNADTERHMRDMREESRVKQENERAKERELKDSQRHTEEINKRETDDLNRQGLRNAEFGLQATVRADEDRGDPYSAQIASINFREQNLGGLNKPALYPQYNPEVQALEGERSSVLQKRQRAGQESAFNDDVGNFNDDLDYLQSATLGRRKQIAERDRIGGLVSKASSDAMETEGDNEGAEKTQIFAKFADALNQPLISIAEKSALLTARFEELANVTEREKFRVQHLGDDNTTTALRQGGNVQGANFNTNLTDFQEKIRGKTGEELRQLEIQEHLALTDPRANFGAEGNALDAVIGQQLNPAKSGDYDARRALGKALHELGEDPTTKTHGHLLTDAQLGLQGMSNPKLLAEAIASAMQKLLGSATLVPIGRR